MTKVRVNYQWGQGSVFGEPNMCVYIGGVCNHAVTHIEKETFANVSPSDYSKPLRTLFYDIEVCDRCESWYDEINQQWMLTERAYHEN